MARDDKGQFVPGPQPEIQGGHRPKGSTNVALVDYLHEQRVLMRPTPSIIAGAVRELQLCPRDVRLALVTVDAAMKDRMASLDVEELRGQVFAGLQSIYQRALMVEPVPHLKTALEALGQIVRLFGLDAAERLNVNVSGLDLSQGAITSLQAIKERIAELRAAEDKGPKAN